MRKLFPSIQVEKPEELPGLMQVQTLEDGRDSLVQGLRKFADARMEKDGEEERDFRHLYQIYAMQENTREWTHEMEQKAFSATVTGLLPERRPWLFSGVPFWGA